MHFRLQQKLAAQAVKPLADPRSLDLCKDKLFTHHSCSSLTIVPAAASGIWPGMFNQKCTAGLKSASAALPRDSFQLAKQLIGAEKTEHTSTQERSV